MLKNLTKKSALARSMVRRYRARARLPGTEDLIGKDAATWKQVLASPRSGGNILFATSGGGNLPAVALETLLAVALTLRNANVKVLLCDGILPACLLCDIDWYRNESRFAANGPEKSHCRDCFSLTSRLYERLGIPVLRYTDFTEPADLEKIEEISAATPYREIANYIDAGARVGEQALAGALRFYARATLDDEHSEKILRRYFKAALVTAHVMRRLLREQDVDCAVFDHGIYVPNGVVGEVARGEGVRVVNWHVAYRKRCFLFSHHETYHHTLLSEPTEHWENMEWTEETEREILEYLNSRWWGTEDWITFNKNAEFALSAIEKELGIDFSKPTIGLLTNVMWDAQLHYPANAFKDMLEWITATIGYFAKRPDLQLLIRVHPAEITGTLPSRQPILAEIRKAFPALPANIFVVPPESKLSTYPMMKQCNAAIIYGTKAGVELTSMGIPTIVAGEAWIRNKGITMDAGTREEYRALLDKLPLSAPLGGELVQRARKYAYHFFFRRMIPLDCVEPTNFVPPFRAAVDSIGSLGVGQDAGLDVICNGILNGTPFIYPAEKSGRGLEEVGKQ
jgi:hypothetical protein